ncbi:MAG: SAM-dependent methyltransferase, partial [candidate division Zixibacteria bacterium]|nr:SAM-dependent methyltransferase [candidate division Zixibacteria bacterium]
SLKATVLDLAGPITTARRLHTEEDGPEDIEFRVGDALKDELGENWDAVLLINFVHVFN